ncbi:MAG: TolC family protein, partial [Gemmatimonas sp.]
MLEIFYSISQSDAWLLSRRILSVSVRKAWRSAARSQRRRDQLAQQLLHLVPRTAAQRLAMLLAAGAGLSGLVAPRSMIAQPSLRADSRLVSVWRELGDTTLERLTSEALAANNDVRAAQATVRGARLARRLVAFDFAPTVTLSSGINRRRMSAAQFPGMPANLREQDIYDAGFDASWELDIFGRTRNTYRAQDAAANSVEETLRDVQLSLVSEVARTYFELRGAERQMVVADRNVSNQKRTLQLTIDRLAAGRGTAFDRERASAQVSTTLAGVASVEAQIATAKYRLEVLLGHDAKVDPLPNSNAEDIDADDLYSVDLPEAPAMQAVSQLVSRRPDVRSAEERLNADERMVAASRSELLPRVSVIGSMGLNSSSTSTFGNHESSRFTIGPVLSWPAFNFGRVHTRSEGSRAAADPTRAPRDQTTLPAGAEVQIAI